MEKSSHTCVKLQTGTAFQLEQAPVFYIKTTLLLGVGSLSFLWLEGRLLFVEQ